MESGKLKMESGKLKMESGKWKTRIEEIDYYHSQM
jgi:hypothetical protein